MDNFIEVMPEGYSLQALDECGVSDRQPHVRQKASLVFSPSELLVEGDLADRTVVWDRDAIAASYEGLDGELAYVLAVTYATDKGHDRTQSLWSGDVEIHGPRVLHKGRAERLLLTVPRRAVRQGRLQLTFKREGDGDAVLGAVELWAPLPPPRILHLLQLETLFSDLQGEVTDIRFRKIAGAAVELEGSGGGRAATETGSDGRFRFSRETVRDVAAGGGVTVTAVWHDYTGNVELSRDDLSFAPVRFRPIPATVADLATPRLSLDGPWRVNAKPGERFREEEIAGWKSIQVPGQFAQQGIDVPDDQAVAVSREFAIPREWAGSRLFLRFDAVHGRTRYWVNGRFLGESENLFTPVEWEITEGAHAGAANRLDLLMTVLTASEQLSYSCGYVFHSLGGIDRKVQLFALPKVHVRDLRLKTDLDGEHRDATVTLELSVENPHDTAMEGLSLGLTLTGPSGEPVPHSLPETRFAVGAASTETLTLAAGVANPLKWSAERPALYRLAVELRRDGALLERIERDVGFRSVSVRGSQLYLNGRRIKLAGALHHELHPLTGRADTARWGQKDLELLKGANLNYVRTIHYPPPEELLESADRLGVYVECEAPFCWVGERTRDVPLREVLTPTSAMIDFCHSHPSVIIWSIANESEFKSFFKVSNRLCKELDPTRPTTFNNPDPERVCDLANLHYPPAPWDSELVGDPRPIVLDEYFFPLCHAQREMRVNPGLRELWGHGHADPDSPWGRFCATSFDDRSYLHPGIPSGGWSSIVRSDRLIGGAICALVDEPFYLPRGRKAGYAFEHGFWGLVDGWRRPKPEWWLAKHIFSPVWFPKRNLPFTPGQASVLIPVENRYSFRDLGELTLSWTLGDRTGIVKADLPPASSGTLEVPVSEGTREGSRLSVRVLDGEKGLVTETVFTLGKPPAVALRRPGSGCPRWKEEAGLIVVEGAGFGMVLDRATLRGVLSDPRHRTAVTAFPSVHLTRIDIAVLAEPRAAPYAVFPDPNTRRIAEVSVQERPSGLEITVRDSYDILSGSLSWLIDGDGMSRVRSRYEYRGTGLGAREIGVRFALGPQYDRLAWRRWSEWDTFPADSVCRTEGWALARRDEALGPGGESMPPAWPWALDQNEYGTSDFRGVKFHVYEASLTSARTAAGGLRIHANADAHVRTCLDPTSDAVLLHALSDCRLGQIRLRPGDEVCSEFIVELLPWRSAARDRTPAESEEASGIKQGTGERKRRANA